MRRSDLLSEFNTSNPFSLLSKELEETLYYEADILKDNENVKESQKNKLKNISWTMQSADLPDGLADVNKRGQRARARCKSPYLESGDLDCNGAKYHPIRLEKSMDLGQDCFDPDLDRAFVRAC